MRKKLAGALSCAMLLLASGCAPEAQPPLPAPADPPEMTAQPSVGVLTATFFSCGDADSTLIQTPDFTVLIDTATNKEGKNVVRRMQQLGVTDIDLLIITHTHKDHVGGAEHVLDSFAVKDVAMGPLVVDSKQVDQFSAALDAQNLAARILHAGDAFALGDLRVEVLAPLRDAYEDENDLSLVFRLSWGETAFLFPGDIEKRAIGDLLAANAPMRAQVLKVPHHGKGEDNSTLFFQAVAPQYAVIPCKRGTKDNLPDASRVVAPLKKLGAKVFVTHDGEITITSDGQSVHAARQ